MSGISAFGAVVIALGLVLGFIMSNIYVAASGIGTGIFILIIGALADRLDTAINILREIADTLKKEKPDEK